MFGLGMTELLVVFVVALLFLGPEKLPDAAKKLSKGIRDFREHGRDLQRTLDQDTDLGSAVRDLKSALRGDEIRLAVAQYESPPEQKAREDSDPTDDDDAPVERESTREPDPYDLRGRAVREAAAKETEAREPSDSEEPSSSPAADQPSDAKKDPPDPHA